MLCCQIKIGSDVTSKPIAGSLFLFPHSLLNFRNLVESTADHGALEVQRTFSGAPRTWRSKFFVFFPFPTAIITDQILFGSFQLFVWFIFHFLSFKEASVHGREWLLHCCPDECFVGDGTLQKADHIIAQLLKFANKNPPRKVVCGFVSEIIVFDSAVPNQLDYCLYCETSK